MHQEGDVIIAGDFNVKIKTDHKEYIQEESRNGQILKDVTEERGRTARNIRNDTIKWPRENRMNNE